MSGVFISTAVIGILKLPVWDDISFTKVQGNSSQPKISVEPCDIFELSSWSETDMLGYNNIHIDNHN